MITEELLSYIKKQLEAGHSNETVRKILIDHKWKETDVDQAFSTILGARPQNNQADVASIMRPGFAGGQANQVNQVSAENPIQQTQLAQEEIHSQAQTQVQPQNQTQPPVQQPQPQIQPQAQSIQQPQSIYREPIESEDKVLQPEIARPQEIRIEPKTDSQVFMPKTFSPKPASPQPEKQIQFQKPIPKEEVADPNLSLGNNIDAGNDFYNSLKDKGVENTPKEEIVGQTQIPSQSPNQNISFEKPKAPEVKEEAKLEGGRSLGQSFLKPKTFSGQTLSSDLQNQAKEMEVPKYGKFATPKAEENLPTLSKETRPPIGAMPASLYDKNRPEAVTLREAQNKEPFKWANQGNPNITERPIREAPSKLGGFFKKLLTIFLLSLIILAGAYAYNKFLKPELNQKIEEINQEDVLVEKNTQENQNDIEVFSSEGMIKVATREILVDLQGLASAYQSKNSGKYAGVCQDANSGFLMRFRALSGFGQDFAPICKDGNTGFFIGAKYAEDKFLCVDKNKITEADLAGISADGLTCIVSEEAVSKDNYTKEAITLFIDTVKSYKNQNQNSFAGLCDSQDFLAFSRGAESAIQKSPQCLSSETEFAIFSSLASGGYACIDGAFKYAVATTPRTTTSCK